MNIIFDHIWSVKTFEKCEQNQLEPFSEGGGVCILLLGRGPGFFIHCKISFSYAKLFCNLFSGSHIRSNQYRGGKSNHGNSELRILW